MRDAIWTFVIVHKVLQICELLLSLKTRQYITMQEIMVFPGHVSSQKEVSEEKLKLGE